MHFSRLKLHGFKSFSDLTELHLEPGLTGVVGPNGCGKSNLVEALRWVMGESSYKAMRASGMDDVIFAGGGNRPARNSAEVTLVLDNSDRTAPAALNNADVLEVTRRIEREEGSVYRVNGREVRARDVQLLFADASTGAHSPALVRQGQIGELIAAKPVQRRALLEEAAGISGLHSRRHEAELRLKGAEQNLERVDDTIAQIEQQLDQLKRQARLAVRYRGLSGEIRKAEATLFHLRWVKARVAEKETEALQGKLIVTLGDAMHLEREAQKAVEAAEEALGPLRSREAATAAALQRLTIHAEQLDEEAKRAEQRRAELEDRRTQLTADAEREGAHRQEGEAALTAIAAEIAQIEAEAAGAADAFAAHRVAAEAAQAAVAEADRIARAASDALAQLRAGRGAAQRAAAEAAGRATRMAAQLADVEQQAAAAAAALAADSDVEDKRSALEAAQTAAALAERKAVAAEEAAQSAVAAVEAARPQVQESEAALTRLEAEAATLARMLQRGSETLWPAIVDSLTVTPGYETALGAALGDDLEASGDGGAPIHWAGSHPGSDDPALPGGVEPLSLYVGGSELVTRRLMQIGVVSRAEGPRLQKQLKAGQRLVTREGDVWRWDGLVSAGDAANPAAERLAQRNRLAELDAEVDTARRERERRRTTLADLSARLERARQDERTEREAWRMAQRQIATAQQAVDVAQRALGELSSKQSALDEARTRLSASLADAEASRGAADATLAGLADEADASAEAAQTLAALQTQRAAADEARLRLASSESAAKLREGRLAQLGLDRQGWERRHAGATAQLATIEERRRELEERLAALTATPEQFAERRAALDEQISAAKATQGEAADALAVAQTRHRDADKALKLAGEGLFGTREEMARIDERLKGLIAQRHQVERQVVETLQIQAEETAAAAGIKPEHALPEEGAIEQKVDRLKAERERLGGVNLVADREAEEVQQKLDVMVKDRDDLVAAIAKLRGGIQSLNREGRTRLSEAFETVNGHFQELFTSLFGGGTAELQFVESDDPLEAGLEVIARPPGKKPATMTLLSGGEQALTALSLIFAVFLTNPAPICVLDEVDAPLDDANVERFCTLLDTMCLRTQTRFLVITHNPITMSRVDRLFGVTMMERGVSQLVSVDLKGAMEVVEAQVATA